jgi:hypothetical protein
MLDHHECPKSAEAISSFITALAVALLTDGNVNYDSEAKGRDFDTILIRIASSQQKGAFCENMRFSQFFASTRQLAQTPEREVTHGRILKSGIKRNKVLCATKNCCRNIIRPLLL